MKTTPELIIKISHMLAEITFELAQARIRAGITHEELARKCGLKPSYIRKIENIDKIPRLSDVLKIAACLGVEELHLGKHKINMFL